MIDPLADVVDIDPNWGELHDVVRRARLEPQWLYVLHRDGRVVRVVGDPGGRVQIGAQVPDPTALAQRLRAETAADRVVVIDADQLPELVGAAVEAADPAWTRPGFRSEVTRQYWASAAVATDPAPPVAIWGPLEQSMREHAPAHLVVILRVDNDRATAMPDWLAGKPPLVTELVVEHGVVTRLSSLDPASAADRPASDDLIHVTLSWADLYGLITTADPVGLADVLIEREVVLSGRDLLVRFLEPLERRAVTAVQSSQGDAPRAASTGRAGVL